MILRLSTATQLSTNLLFAWNQFSFWKEQMNRYISQYKSMKSVKIKINKSINETSVSSISTNWLIQSISIKSDLPIVIDLSVKIGTDCIDWLLRAYFKDVIQYYYIVNSVRCPLNRGYQQYRNQPNTLLSLF